MLDLLIIGGGISGLSVAWEAMKAGLSFRLLEAEPDLGGAISSFVRYGTLFETGPAALQVTSPAVDQLLGELGLLDSLVSAPFAPPWLHAAPETGGSGGAMASLAGGIGQLVRALKTRIGPLALTGSPVRSISPPPYGWKVEVEDRVLRAHKLVIATAASHCANLLEEFDLRGANLVRGIPTVSLAVLNQVYKSEQLPSNAWKIGNVQFPLSRPGVVSSVTLHQLPPKATDTDQNVGIRIYVGGPGRERAFLCEDRFLNEQASKELRTLIDVRGRPLASNWTRHTMGVPTFGPAHADRLQEVGRALSSWPDLHLTGNWLHRPGIAESVTRAANLVADFARDFRPHTAIR